MLFQKSWLIFGSFEIRIKPGSQMGLEPKSIIKHRVEAKLAQKLRAICCMWALWSRPNSLFFRRLSIQQQKIKFLSSGGHFPPGGCEMSSHVARRSVPIGRRLTTFFLQGKSSRGEITRCGASCQGVSGTRYKITILIMISWWYGYACDDFSLPNSIL